MEQKMDNFIKTYGGQFNELTGIANEIMEKSEIRWKTVEKDKVIKVEDIMKDYGKVPVKAPLETVKKPTKSVAKKKEPVIQRPIAVEKPKLKFEKASDFFVYDFSEHAEVYAEYMPDVGPKATPLEIFKKIAVKSNPKLSAFQTLVKNRKTEYEK